MAELPAATGGGVDREAGTSLCDLGAFSICVGLGCGFGWAGWALVARGLASRSGKMLTGDLDRVAGQVGELSCLPLAELVNALLLSALLGALLVGLSAASRTCAIRFALCLWGALSFTTGMTLIHPWARILLALGLAVQLAAFATRRWPTVVRLCRRAALPLLLLAGTVGLTPILANAWRRASRQVADAAGRPNVVLIVLDTVRAASLSLHGASAPTTPFLGGDLERESIVFDQAFAPSPWTLPTHASMFTGHLPWSHGADWETYLPADRPTLAEVLRAHGWRTGGFVGNTVYCDRRTRLDRGMDHYDAHDHWPSFLGDNRNSVRRIVEVLGHSTKWLRRVARRITGGRFGSVRWSPPRARKAAGQVNGEFLAWLDGDPQAPFFAFINYFDAHSGYEPPPPFDTLPGFEGPGGAEAPRRREDRISYERCIAALDAHLSELMQQLKQRGVFDNTLVIITSDHGEQFAEHGPDMRWHGNSLYSQLLWVPLVIRLPGGRPSARIGDHVSLCDLPQTVFDLVGLGRQAAFPGDSLARFWTQTKRRPGRLVRAQLSRLGVGLRGRQNETGDMSSIISSELHYITHHTEGWEKLFEYRRDPAELRDVHAEPRFAKALARFRSLVRKRAGQGAPRSGD